MAAERIRIMIEVDIEPDVDASAFQIASAVVLAGLHEASLYPDWLVVETLDNGHPITPSSEREYGSNRAGGES